MDPFLYTSELRKVTAGGVEGGLPRQDGYLGY